MTLPELSDAYVGVLREPGKRADFRFSTTFYRTAKPIISVLSELLKPPTFPTLLPTIAINPRFFLTFLIPSPTPVMPLLCSHPPLSVKTFKSFLLIKSLSSGQPIHLLHQTLPPHLALLLFSVSSSHYPSHHFPTSSVHKLPH